jgi:DNA modification methylase
MGPHRLLCGDSCKEDDVERLWKGAPEKASLFATDPPYGVGYGVEGGPDSAKRFEAITNDELKNEELEAFLASVFRVAIPHLKPTAAWYIWHAHATQGIFAQAACASVDLLIHRQIIWAKDHFVLGHGDYHFQHELCFYGWREGNRAPWYADRRESTLWLIARPSAAIYHPTEKPPALFARSMRNSTQPGEYCYEPFSGSGSQFCAASAANRVCYGLEIEPKFVAVALERLEEMGLSPELVRK